MASKQDNFTLDLDFTRIPNAVEFITSTARFPTIVGGVGSGKSYSLIVKTLIHLMRYPGDRGWMVRSTYRQLNDTLRKDFFTVLGCTAYSAHKHPIIDRFNQSDNTIYFKNGSELSFRYAEGKKAVESLQSANLSFIAIDQLEQISEAFLEECDSRIRYGTGPHWVGSISNARGKNFIWRRWWRDYVDDPDWQGWIMRTMDNPYLPPEYVPNLLKNHGKEWVNRFVYSSFNSYEGQVFHEFNEDIHVINNFDPPAHWPRWYSMDFGLIDPTVVLCFCSDDNGNIIQFDEIYEKKALPPEVAILMREKKITGLDTIYADPAGKQKSQQTGDTFFGLYFDQGYNLIKANNAIAPGIIVVNDLMKVRPAPHPYNFGQVMSSNFYIMRKCEKTLEEVPNYQYPNIPTHKEGFMNAIEKPKDVDNHCMDCWRYGLNSGTAKILEPSETNKIIDRDEGWDDMFPEELRERRANKGKTWRDY